MIKRTLYFGNPVYLSLQHGQMVVRYPEIEKNNTLPDKFKKDNVTYIPVEDTGIVVLDNAQITITHSLLSALMANNTAVMSCDSSHHPAGLFLPLEGNSLQSERYRAQLDASEPLKKQLWAQTISRKIKNQSALLSKLNIESQYLKPLFRDVKSGDSDNCEATAAAYYWSHIFSFIPGFRRHREGAYPNSLLNYGYSIIRAVMARSIVSAGLLPTLGIHHRNRYNAYCLADDLMEPYRPFVDEIVYRMLCQDKSANELTKKEKAVLLGLPAIDVRIDGEKSPLMIAAQRTAVSLVKCFEGEQRRLLYPDLE